MQQRKNDPAREEALVIRSIRYSESSRIVTFFGQKKGKFTVIAKGSRRQRSGSALSAVEPPGRIEAIVYFKPGRSVQTLGQISVLDGYRAIRNDLALTGFSSVILQLLNVSFTDYESNEEAYRHSVEALENLSNPDNNSRLVLWSFMLNLIRAIGFGIDFYQCPVCGKSIADISRNNLLLLETGKICCYTCTPVNGSHLSLSGESVSILRQVSSKPLSVIRNLRFSINAKREITSILEQFLRFHHPNAGKLTALSMLDNLESPLSNPA